MISFNNWHTRFKSGRIEERIYWQGLWTPFLRRRADLERRPYDMRMVFREQLDGGHWECFTHDKWMTWAYGIGNLADPGKTGGFALLCDEVRDEN